MCGVRVGAGCVPGGRGLQVHMAGGNRSTLVVDPSNKNLRTLLCPNEAHAWFCPGA